ncbi:contactin-associated protein like 5-3 [Caerostris extrusa]|uniref:Contactin-associated protein like 5-3 n=1 Tax=Caerostris extrusa TaxID=172846 RepID=A0AAV4PYM7_CAEEX|nr:contactin-associated protein like 5-3 [Caerostris extrusa]
MSLDVAVHQRARGAIPCPFIQFVVIKQACIGIRIRSWQTCTSKPQGFSCDRRRYRIGGHLRQILQRALLRHSSHRSRKFLNAYACYVYPVTEPEFVELTVNCSQPIYGQYVTLQVYDRFDSLRFCEMKVFGTESCGQPLGMASEEIFDEEISASSSDDVEKYSHYHTNARLNANLGWCASHTDEGRTLIVNLEHHDGYRNSASRPPTVPRRKQSPKSFSCISAMTTALDFRRRARGGVHQRLGVEIQPSKGNSSQVRHDKDCGCLSSSSLVFLRLKFWGCRQKANCDIIKSDPPGKHIEINFIVYDLAVKDDSLEYGSCRDELAVYPEYGNEFSIKSPDGKFFPKRIISNGPLKMHLQSCFRNSRSRYKGFYAKFKTVDCPGCGAGDFQCSERYLCETTCGRILSIGYPLNYQNNHRCGWLIRTKPSYFINLTFLDFDIIGGENCQNDYFAVYDGNKNHKAHLIGRFCNEKKPPDQIVSSWNSLLLEFSSDADATGKGFSLEYTSRSFQMPKDIEYAIENDEDKSGCPEEWKYYNGNCYNAFHLNTSLQWYEAEMLCKEEGEERNSHLVSILDKKENAVLHHFLTNEWRAKHKSLYIGTY